MSWKATAWAKEQTTGSPAKKALLLCLADYADENHSCFPGQELLARETEQSDRTVRRQLQDLEKMGLIRRERRWTKDGYRTSDRYVLAVDGPTGQVGRLDSGAPTGQPGSGLPDTVMSGEQLEEQPEKEGGAPEPGDHPIAAEEVDEIDTDLAVGALCEWLDLTPTELERARIVRALGEIPYDQRPAVVRAATAEQRPKRITHPAGFVINRLAEVWDQRRPTG